MTEINEEENPYVEVQQQVKTLVTEYVKSVFEEMQKDTDFVENHDVQVIESILGTMNAVVSNFNWDRIARNIDGKPILLVRKFNIPEEEVVDGFKFGLEGVSTEYNEVFKTEEDRESAIEDAGLVIYNG